MLAGQFCAATSGIAIRVMQGVAGRARPGEPDRHEDVSTVEVIAQASVTLPERLHGLASGLDGPTELSPGCTLYFRNLCTPGWLGSSRSTSKKCCFASANRPCWARVTPKL